LKGFIITLTLPDCYYNGLEAIDLCRKYQLAELSEVATLAYDRHPYEVEDEAFIRTWFPYRSNHADAVIDLDWLSADQVELKGQRVAIKNRFDEATVKALFIRARFASLQKNLEKAEAKLAEASAKLSAAASEEEEES